MNHNVTQKLQTERLKSVVHIRIEAPTLSQFRTIAEREGRTPCNLARKVITDFVRSSQLEAAKKTVPILEAV